MIAFNSTAHPNRYWWSKQNRYSFPGSAAAAGNWNDIGQSGETIIATTRAGRNLHFYLSNSVWRHVGDPGQTDGNVEQATRVKFGITGPLVGLKTPLNECPESSTRRPGASPSTLLVG